MSERGFSSQALSLDCAAEAEAIAAGMRAALVSDLHRRGIVVAVSGGIDSSVCLALATRAVGSARVLALILPERDSSPDSAWRAQMLTAHLNVQTVVQDIAGTLEAVGCYRWRDEAVCRAVPSYGPGWRMKIVISGGTDGRVNVFRIIASAPDGSVIDKRLRLQDYLQIVAATNFKQRVRKTLEYFHADRLNYAVAGTPNRLEYDQGFFVKNGDGAADFKPIAHLYKTQVYAMARYFDLPEQICRAEPTTDTYSLEQGQDEFFFALPYRQMDLALWGRDRGITPEAMAAELGFSVERMRAIYADIDAKRRNARYLHAPALLMRPLSGRQD